MDRELSNLAKTEDSPAEKGGGAASFPWIERSKAESPPKRGWLGYSIGPLGLPSHPIGLV